MTATSNGPEHAAPAGAGAGERPRLLSWLLRGVGSGAYTLIRKSVTVVVLAVLSLVVIRAYLATQGQPLRPWHTIVPTELSAQAIASGNWQTYVAAEARMFEQLHRRLRSEMEPEDRTLLNRYHDASMTSPTAFGRDWNRSYVLEPDGTARGVAVLVHGLTDSPYSMRSLAELYRRHGYVALVPRMPGHGTVPAGLTHEGRKEWTAAVEMTMAEARRRAGNRLPVHLVGYSNGGALALLHVMTRLKEGARDDVDRVVLLSPMIEVNRFARYAGLAGLPALFPRYAKSAWLDLLPEYNPFKYNSFPVRAARESYLVTADLHAAIEAVARQGRLAQVPPILAFQSVVDDTVSARGVMSELFDRLAANGSELVLFDVNRSAAMAPMLRPTEGDWPHAAQQALRRYMLTVVTRASPDDATAMAQSRPAGASVLQEHALGVRYPNDVYSLSHIALPFAADDPLYGDHPPEGSASGRRIVQLGAIAVRGERNTLQVSQDSLSRLSYNPFHAYMTARIAALIDPVGR